MNTLTRRSILRGFGTAVALPFLPSAGPAHAEAPPRRLVVWYVPNGFIMKDWTLAAEGADYPLSPVLTPLAPVKSDVLVVSGLANMPGEQGIGDHPMGTGAFLTAAKVAPTSGANVRASVSMDQVAAATLAARTPGHIRSMQLGAEGRSRGPTCDLYTCTYTDNISWASPTTPLAKVVEPRAVFDTLFAGAAGAGESAAAADRRRALDRSVLDYVLGEVQGLSPRLARSDRARLDEYLTAVREVEQRVAAVDNGPMCAAPAAPAADLDLTARIDVMSDLTVLALRCDRTRVVTFMLANGATERTHPFLRVDGAPITEAYHPLTHSAQNESWRRKIDEISRWEVARFVALVQRLKAVPEAGGTLLDRCAVFLSSEMSDPSTHAHDNMPVLLAGGAAGFSRAGRHLRTTGSFGDLYVTMLNALGVPTTRFGDDGTKSLAL